MILQLQDEYVDASSKINHGNLEYRFDDPFSDLFIDTPQITYQFFAWLSNWDHLRDLPHWYPQKFSMGVEVLWGKVPIIGSPES